MAKDEPTNQLNLTVVALVALVAIVGLVALVMNAASITPRLATGSEVVSAEEQNIAGDGTKVVPMYRDDDYGGADAKKCCTGEAAVGTCTKYGNKNRCEAVGCTWSCGK